jgi:CheY-like chemotaxis protein
MLALQAAARNLELIVHLHADVPARVIADPQRIRQCLINLVNNAVKFTAQGQVTVEVRTVHQTDGYALTRFEVRDTGIGIAAADLEHLFEPFMQVDSSSTRNFGGTGLGLSIVKRFVEHMGGRVGVHSVMGQGSTFWFDLPLSRPEYLTAASNAAANGSVAPQLSVHTRPLSMEYAGKVLLVEDNAVNQKVAQQFLRRLGCEVITAINGAEALELYQPDTFKLILMDLQMPVMDGFTATTLIRERQGTEDRTPIVALTANAMAGEFERCMAAGMADFMTKPLNVDRLRAVLDRCGMRRMPEQLMAEAADATQARAEDAESHCSSVPIDLSALEQMVDGDAQFEQELLETFVEGVTQMSSELLEQLGRGERGEMTRTAHRLKGAAGNVYALTLKELSAQLEAQAPTATQQQLRESVNTLCGEVSRTVRFLRSSSRQTVESSAA